MINHVKVDNILFYLITLTFYNLITLELIRFYISPIFKNVFLSTKQMTIRILYLFLQLPGYPLNIFFYSFFPFHIIT